MSAPHAEEVQGAAQVPCVALDRVIEVAWLIGVAEPWHVEGDRAAELTDDTGERRPVLRGPRVPLDENDSLVGADRPRFEDDDRTPSTRTS